MMQSASSVAPLLSRTLVLDTEEEEEAKKAIN